MSDAVWILGASMTKFMRYRDKDSIDLASEAALAALDDGDVSIFDMGILAVGSLFEANAMLGQRLQNLHQDGHREPSPRFPPRFVRPCSMAHGLPPWRSTWSSNSCFPWHAPAR